MSHLAGHVVIYPHGMTAAQVVAVAREGAQVELAPEAVEAMATSRRVVEELAASPIPAYGISTGFGALATRHIPPELRTRLQASLIRSHSAGMGEPVETEVVRALMLLRLKTLASGYTGARPVMAHHLAALLELRRDAGRPIIGFVGLQRRPGSPGPLCAGADGRGRGYWPGRPASQRVERSGRG